MGDEDEAAPATFSVAPRALTPRGGEAEDEEEDDYGDDDFGADNGGEDEDGEDVSKAEGSIDGTVENSKAEESTSGAGASLEGVAVLGEAASEEREGHEVDGSAGGDGEEGHSRGSESSRGDEAASAGGEGSGSEESARGGAEAARAEEGVGASGDGPPLDETAMCTMRLHDAARGGAADEATAALDGGARIDDLDPWGQGPLHNATIAGHVEVCLLLLSRQAAPDNVSKAGKTPLHYASSNGHLQVLQALLDLRADFLKETPTGATPLELARKSLPNGPCEQIVRNSLAKRLAEAEAAEADLRQRLAASDSRAQELRRQLGCEQTDQDPHVQEPLHAARPNLVRCTSEGQKETPAEPGNRYWDIVLRKLNECCAQGKDALKGAVVRNPPLGSGLDAFPWTDDFVAISPLPTLDPDDAVIQEGFRRAAEACIPSDHEVDLALVEKTGRSLQEWESLVLELRADGGQWDWSAVQVMGRERAGGPLDAGVTATACAAGIPELHKEPIFKQHEVIGPLGGVFRRRPRYEQMYYPKRRFTLHDPTAYEFKLRTKAPGVKLEQIVLDLATGSSANRLRYLVDARIDPLGLQFLLKGAGASGAFAFPAIDLPPRIHGGPMLRPRSRGSMPPAKAEQDGATEANQATETAAPDVSSPESMGARRRSSGRKRSTQKLVAADPAALLAYAEGVRAAANVQVVEVHVQGWPYAFAVATRNIYAGEILAVDRGEEYWATQRAALARVQAMQQLGSDLAKGAARQRRTEEAVIPPATFRQRAPMPRPHLDPLPRPHLEKKK